MKRTVIAQRGDYIFIVKQEGKYYLVNLRTKKCEIAEPDDSPDMFLKFGYFVSPHDISEGTAQEIREVLASFKE